jgi:hypothetical protein
VARSLTVRQQVHLSRKLRNIFLHVINARGTCPVDNILTAKIALVSDARYSMCEQNPNREIRRQMVMTTGSIRGLHPQGAISDDQIINTSFYLEFDSSKSHKQ